MTQTEGDKRVKLTNAFNTAKRARIALNKEEFAQKLGYSRSHMHKFMAGESPIPDGLIEAAEKLNNDTNIVLSESQEEYGTLTMKALVNLTESNRVLAESNKTLAESHSRLVTMVETKSTESGPQEIPEAVDAKLTDALVLLAEIGSGKKWKSVQEGLAEIHKRFSGVHRTVEVKGIQKRGDRLHKEK